MKKNSPRSHKVIAASVTGSLHSMQKQPCQDCCRHAAGRNLVAVVSDGAGSSKYGKIGARIVCETLCDLLKDVPLKQAKAKVYQALAVAREKLTRHRLNRQKNESGIGDFAATVVGAVCRKGDGFFFHIGDGAAIALHGDLSSFTASRPENGSFACETFFYTQQAWADNLRFTDFENAETLFLMSDGLTGFAFAKDFTEIEKGFIMPINNFLTNEACAAKAVRALHNTLNTPRAQKLNPDDKTLLWAKVK